MKRNPPPFKLGPEEMAHWRALIQEVGGIRGWSEFWIWRLALTAQHQAAYFALNLPNELIATMCEYRRELELPGRPEMDSDLYWPITKYSALRRVRLRRQQARRYRPGGLCQTGAAR